MRLRKLSASALAFLSVQNALLVLNSESCAETTNRTPVLPSGFVYLREIDPTIFQDIRYATSRNFIGHPITGYLAQECILTIAAAKALSKVQKALPSDRSLTVYDCYRPQMAVQDFMKWSRDPDESKKREHYPNVEKSKLIGLGYISKNSAHSRGSAVDLAITTRTETVATTSSTDRDCTHPDPQADGGLDYGTTYDCFHELSATAHPRILGAARENREFLVREMARAGFNNYRREWWHFELRDEPFSTSFNFPILPNVSDVDRQSPKANQADLSKIAEDFGTLEKCGPPQALRIVCMAGNESIQAHQSPSGTAPVTSKVLVSTDHLSCRRCTGTMSLNEYFALDPVARLTARAPWCLIASGTGESDALLGWITATHLGSADPADCSSRR